MASRSVKNRPSVKKKHPWYGLLIFVTVLVAVVAAGGVGVYALGSSWLAPETLPDYRNLDSFNVSKASEVVSSDESTQLAKFQAENREQIELNQISPYIVQGTVATEDERFYDHGGFDLAGIARAVVVNITGSGKEGASTITQQVVRNTILFDEMNDISIKRKVREMYLSVKVEELYSKDEILLMYLNTINYGSGAYGIQAASQRYYSKNAADLTLSEAATLIGIPQSPTYNNPIDNPETCLARRNLVLDRMLSNGYITQEEHDTAKLEPIVLNPTVPTVDGIVAYPYFTSYVRYVLTDPNGPYNFTEEEILKGGYRVVTTLDTTLQGEAETAVANKEESLAYATGTDALQGSLVSIEPSTGHIKALVGGRDWATDKFNLATGDLTSANPGRPCGSSFKTFTLIAALEAGISPQTILDCSNPAVLPEAGYPASSPLNNINNRNFGYRTIAGAFEVSSNTGFVRLQMSLGADKVVEVAQRMGITSPLNAVGSLTLGQQNVTMLDMSSAYSAIANNGVHVDSTPILKIYDSEGNLIVDNTTPDTELARTKSAQVISPEVAHAATEVMKTVVTGSEGTGSDARLSSGQTVAAKTGTSSSYMDITFCGITPQLSTAIWFGDKSNQVEIPSSTGAGDVFSEFMNAALRGQPLEDFDYAAAPSYKAYTDTKYHIGGTSSSSNKSEDKASTDTGNGSSGTTGNGTTGGGTSGGGTTGGGTTGGGTDPGTGGGTDPGTGGGTGGGTDPGTGGGTGGDTGGGTGGGTNPGTGGGTTPSSVSLRFESAVWSRMLLPFAS
ncbi:MAG: transglycosylase domain-containing protein [Gordonibacter sp.]|nr:transglycosylase domain-containing protein [Gordonibacter sp.]